LLLDWPGFSEDPWYAATEAKIVAAIGEAMTHLFPATVVAGKQSFESAYMAHNRRRVNPDGSVTMMWANPDRLPTEPIDPTVGVILVKDDVAKPRAFVVHYACHPVMMMNTGRLSPDFPGAMCDYLEKVLPINCMPMFLQGAAGDLDPYDLGARGKQGIALMRQAGVSLGKGALRVARNLKPRQDQNASLAVREDRVTISYRNKDKTTEALVATVVVNDDLALVTMPGEPFVRLQLHLAEKSPLADTFLLGFAYCGAGSPWLRYIPDEQSAGEGGFGASTNWYTFIAVDGGEKMVDRGVASIRAMIE